MRTRTHIVFFIAFLYILFLAMLPFMLISFIFVRDYIGRTFICIFGLIIYSIFLIIDTMIIFKDIDGRGKHSYIEFGYGDCIIGAMMLYMDIIMIFLYLLALFGGR